MASKIKQKLLDSVGTADIEPNHELLDKYLLSVTAGPSYDERTHKQVSVNKPDQTCSFSNAFMTTKIKVRIQNYNGLPAGSPSTSPYFSTKAHAKDQYSIAFSFIPKQDLKGRDIGWGNDFDHPIRDRLPPGFQTAVKIAKELVDPGLDCDAYADKPWLYGPALGCWFTLNVGEKTKDANESDFPIAEDAHPLQEGGEGTGGEVRSRLGIPNDADKRRKFFLDPVNREKFVFEKGRCYQGDFFNPYLDFSNYALRLPGFSLGILKYIDDKSHTLRYVLKDRKSGDVYFVVQLKLLFGEEMQAALERGRSGERSQPASDHSTEGKEDPKASREAAAAAAAKDESSVPQQDLEESAMATPKGYENGANPRGPGKSEPVNTAESSVTNSLEQTSTGNVINKHTDVLDR